MKQFDQINELGEVSYFPYVLSEKMDLHERDGGGKLYTDFFQETDDDKQLKEPAHHD